MRKFVAIAFVAAAAFWMNVTLAAAAEDTQVKKAQSSQTEKQPAQSKTAAKDTNYRFHNGQWFYWMPQTKSWKVWNGQQWNDFQGSQTRTFSYEAGDTGSYPTFERSFNAGYYDYPNNRVIGSFGVRGAGAKTEGRY